MTRMLLGWMIALTAVLTMPCSRASAQDVNLTDGVWTLLGQDLVYWNGSQLKFTQQEPDGTLAGYFDWVSNDQIFFGRELFEGTLLPDLTFTLHGYQLAPHPELGGPGGLSLADYAGRITPDGKRIVDGTWLTHGGSPGTWESVYVVPEPSSCCLLAVGAMTGIASWRRSRRRTAS